MSGFLAFVAIYATGELHVAGAGGVLLLFGSIVIATRVLFARLPDRVPPFRLGTLALALCAIGLLIASGIASLAGLLIGTAVLAAGVAFTTPAMFAAIFARADAAHRGSASGTASLFLDLAFGGGPMVTGLVAGAAGIPSAFAVAAALAAVGAMGSAVLAWRDRPATSARARLGEPLRAEP
jgi:predicted MFS family arabinose efflux permease